MHKFFHKLLHLKQPIATTNAADLVVFHHTVRVNARVVDEKRHWLFHMGAYLHWCGMVGQNGNSHWLFPSLHLIVYRFHDASVEVFYGA